jgi:hypothetical protein
LTLHLKIPKMMEHPLLFKAAKEVQLKISALIGVFAV